MENNSISIVVIKASCNPYHARLHYNREPVLRLNGPTPVEWIVKICKDRDDAVEALMRLAKTSNPYESGNWTYEDEASVKELEKQIREDHPEDFEDGESHILSAWYKGPGIYEHGSRDPLPVLLEGGTSFEDDTMAYSVEEIEAEDYAMALLGHKGGCVCSLLHKVSDHANKGSLLVFEFNGNGESSAYLYDDGSVFCLSDWQGGHPETLQEMEDYDWETISGHPAILLDGAPRILF